MDHGDVVSRRSNRCFLRGGAMVITRDTSFMAMLRLDLTADWVSGVSWRVALSLLVRAFRGLYPPRHVCCFLVLSYMTVTNAVLSPSCKYICLSNAALEVPW